ncbi:MAG: ribosomal protein S18-alanine N-acetyltransferase [Acidobacteria bacterium]|nr:ribosomal protein S18-alanine N-acetyltransferase [Acidobacteriota bacterium]
MPIRPATAADIPALRQLAEPSPNAAHWSEAQYQAMFAGGQRVFLVLEETSLLGFAVANACSKTEWEVENMVVTAQARRQGHGSRLLQALLQAAGAQGARSVFLEVRESNQAARRLYEKSGFVENGRRPRYYSSPPEDALLYVLSFA